MRPRRFAMNLVIAALVAASGVLAYAQRGQSDRSPRPEAAPGAWTPKEDDPKAYDAIVALNIFDANRLSLARAYDRAQNPDPPRVRPDPPVVVRTPEEPPDPDASLVLRGITRHADSVVVFIEDNDTGSTSRFEGPSDFSQGRIETIGYDAVVYVIDGEERTIAVGQSFTGESVAPKTQAGGRTASSSGRGADGSSGGSANLQDRLAELRARRAREQGGGPAPATVPTSNDDDQPTEPTAAADDRGPDDEDDSDQDDDDPTPSFDPRSNRENE